MIRFRETLERQAKDILSTHSTADELQAVNEINQIDQMTSQLLYSNSNFAIRAQASSLDTRIRNKYPIIDMLQNVVNEMGRSSSHQRRSNGNAQDPLIHQLTMDKIGIWINILLKHQVIETIKDALEDVLVE